MRRRVLAVMVAGLMVAGGAVFSQGAMAVPSLACTGPMSGTINANLFVPSGSTCNLQGATVNGNVAVQPGGRLVVGGGSTINGNLSSQSAGTDTTTNPFGPAESFSVVVCNSKITGTTIISDSASQVLLGGTSVGGGGCGGNSFGNNVSLSDNHAAVIFSNNGGACAAPGGTCGVTGNVNITNNTPGPVTVRGNVISGNLSCFGNGTVTSAGNTAKNKNGQCPA